MGALNICSYSHKWCLSSVVLILFAFSLSDVESFLQDATGDSDIVSIEPEQVLNLIGHNFSSDQGQPSIPAIPAIPKRSANFLIGGPYYMELLLVVDNLIYVRHGENLTAVEHYCQTITHLVNVFFRPMSIHIALNHITVWKDNSHIPVTTNISQTLDNFSSYYNHKLNVSSNVDSVLLLVDQTFDNSSVGISSLRSMCNHSYGMIAVHDRPNMQVAATIAYEIGHMLGLHDEDESCNCVMSGSKFDVFAYPINWGSKTINMLKERLEKRGYPCLTKRSIALFQSPTCGNEFVEMTEDCDCGPKEYCLDQNCDATTCRYKDSHLANGSFNVDA